MRILFLNASGFIGGGERQLLQMLSALKKADPSIEGHLIVLGAGDLIEEARSLGWNVHSIPLPERLAKMGDSSLRDSGKIRRVLWMLADVIGAMPEAAGFLIELRRTIRGIAPDLIHSNGIKTHLLGKWVNPAGVPIVWHVHDYLSLRPLAAWLLKIAKRGIAAAIAISESVRRDAASILADVPIHVILNTVDSQRCSPGRGRGDELDELASMPPPPPSTLRVGLVATFARWKGQNVFLEAARLTRNYTAQSIKFYVIGGAIYQTGNQFSLDELRESARARGIQSDVAFVPFQKDVADVYRALDIVVHASTLPEPFGLTIIEAMACGRPVIVADAGGASELFSDGHDAIGTAPGDAIALAKAIARLSDDPVFRAALGQHARLTIEEKFDARRLGPQLLKLYQSVTH